MKIKIIKLKYYDVYVPNNNKEAWKVIGLTDSVEFNPGQILNRQDIEQLCASKSWRVIVD